MPFFRPNPRLAAELMKQPGYRVALARAAEPARKEADTFARQAKSPWMPKKGSASSDTVVIEQDAGGTKIVLAGHGAHLVEYGSVRNPPHAPLRRGVRAAGLKLKESE